MPRSIHDVASDITRYCTAHSDARDTLEGIAWWLAIQRSSDTLEEIRAAVELLVDQKVLVSYRFSDGTTVFGSSTHGDPHRSGEIEHDG